MDFLLSSSTIGIVGAVLALVVVVTLVVKRYHVVDPDTAMIIVGNKHKRAEGVGDEAKIEISGQRVITGGGAFVWPFIQKPYFLSLASQKLSLQTVGQTINGITVGVRAVAVIKVGGTNEMIRAAAQRFLSQQEGIKDSATEILSGSLRSILGSLTVQEIIKDRQKVAGQVLGAAEEALSKQGLSIDTLQIQEISDNEGYIDNIGRPEAAAVKKAAEIAEIEATKEAEETRINADKYLIDRNRELKLREATVKSETDQALAEAEAAKPLEDAKQKQRIVEQETAAAAKEAELEEQRLNASIKKQADAEAYKIEKIAEADRKAKILSAEGEQSERVQLADAALTEGRNEAEVIKAKGEAEAAAISARADALAKEAQAVLSQQLIEVLPEIVGRLADAYAGIDNLTIVSADGANKITGDVVGNLTSMTQMLKDTVGIDLSAVITGNATGRAIGEGLNGDSREIKTLSHKVSNSTKKDKAVSTQIVDSVKDSSSD